MQDIDRIDMSILFELDRDARRSINEIAKKLNMKRDTVAYRIRQLEETGIITGYYTIIDYAKLGYLLGRLYFKFQDTTVELEEEIIQYLVSLKSVFTVYKTEGDWEIAVGFLIPSLESFDSVLRDFQKKYRKYIHTHNISVFLEYVHYLKNYLVEEQDCDYHLFSTGKGEVVETDETDKRILKIIADKAKIPLLEVSKQLDMTAMAVKYRIQQLEKKKVILGYRALIDYTKYHYEYYKIDLEIEEVGKMAELRQFARQHPNIIYEDRTIGGSDFEFDAELPGHDAFHTLIEEIKKRFPGMIRTYHYFKARKIYKYIYFPE